MDAVLETLDGEIVEAEYAFKIDTLPSEITQLEL